MYVTAFQEAESIQGLDLYRRIYSSRVFEVAKKAMLTCVIEKKYE